MRRHPKDLTCTRDDSATLLTPTGPHRSYGAFCRQTLLGGNYELLDHNTYEPNPDFYAALLWRRLMGVKVLDVDLHRHPRSGSGSGSGSESEMVRAYASCTPRGKTAEARRKSEGSVTLLLLNLSPNTSTVLSIMPAGSFVGEGALAREEYHMAAAPLAHPPRPGAATAVRTTHALRSLAPACLTSWRLCGWRRRIWMSGCADGGCCSTADLSP